MGTWVVQKWQESEAGWGTRPDGWSLHKTEADRVAYIEAYWARMPAYTPNEYSAPCGSPYLVEKEDLIKEHRKKAKNSENGIRVFDNGYPGSGGTDGWMTLK